MIRCFQPRWNPQYGVKRERWRRLCLQQKLMLIQDFRERCRAEALAFNLSQDDYKVAVPFDPSIPFVPVPQSAEEEDYF